MEADTDLDSDVGDSDSKALASHDIWGLTLEPDTDSGDGVAASDSDLNP